MPTAKRDLPTIPFPSREAFRDWLGENGSSAPGLWVKLAKAGSGHPSVTNAEAVEEALAHGWIDGQGARFDDEWWLIRFTPRRRRSKWSKVNTETATRLIAEGQMTPAGMREVEAAKADGRWAVAYDPPSRATVPEGAQPPTELETKDLSPGKGPAAKSGDQLAVNYHGVAFSTGEVFDSSFGRGQPLPVELGAGGVIPGFEQGLEGMKAGGRRQITIPPELAYGPQGSPPAIGPNETLVFVLDLVSIK